MNVIQQTAVIDPGRLLRTGDPLPAAMSAGQENITIPASEFDPAAPPAGKRPRKIWQGDAPWLHNPIGTSTPFIPLTREEAHVRQPLR